MLLAVGFSTDHGLKRIFVIESEYSVAMCEAELAWTRGMVDELAAGSIEGLDDWRGFHRAIAERERQERRDQATRDDSGEER